jgi:hypothetical protein
LLWLKESNSFISLEDNTPVSGRNFLGVLPVKPIVKGSANTPDRIQYSIIGV